jgi:hypothetical protein
MSARLRRPRDPRGRRRSFLAAPRSFRAARRPFRALLVTPLVAICLATLAATPVGAAHGYAKDVYFVGAYERQVDSRTCTAASVAMMMNMLARRDLALNQMAILRWEQPRDALNDRVQRGSDPLGWSRAATYYSRYTPAPTIYRWEAYATKAQAFKRAATQLASTGKPVGLTVWHGRHAVVMTGVTASADPTKRWFTVTGVAISDPLGYSHRWYTASSYPLDTYLEMDATATYDAAWYGKYVVIVPQN